MPRITESFQAQTFHLPLIISLTEVLFLIESYFKLKTFIQNSLDFDCY